jgi:hypothetical protein
MDAALELITTEFTNCVREYDNIVSQIKAVNDELKVFKKRKNELEEAILDFMQANSIPEYPTPHGIIKLFDSKVKTPLNKEYVKEILSNRLDEKTIDIILDLSFDNRPITEVQKLKMTQKKATK